ncbi:MAG TPA: cation diffusion facilitator family transporter [Mariprofundaceae bacterium]|nr:cation diffusion facilitator family transporter [Mariprofundaceae bacterium]
MLNRPDHHEAGRLMKLATYASTATALLLIAAKLVAWFWTDSVSIMATLIDSCLDALASLVNLFAVRHALQPADSKHRFGHGKAEPLAGLGQAAFIAGSAGFLILESVGRLLHPKPLHVIGVGVGVMLFSIAVTVALLIFQRHVVRRTGSTAIRADSLHYKTDLLVNAGVVLALALSSYGWAGFDAVIAIGIAGYIFYSAWDVAMEGIHHLMDHELPEEDRERIRELVLSQKHVRGMHDLRTRRSGTTPFIQLHLELDDNLTLYRAHAISDAVEARIIKAYPNAEVIIHEDPASLMEEQPEFADEDEA